MIENSGPLQSLSIAPSRDHRKQSEEWTSAVSPFYQICRVGERDPSGSFTAWRLASTFFTDTALSAQNFQRRRQEWARDDFGYLSIQLNLVGSAIGEIDGHPFQKSPGAMHLFDFSRSYQSVATDARVLGAIVPHVLVGYDPSRQPAHLVLRQCDAVGYVLIHAFRALIDRLPTATQSEISSLEGAFAGLLRGAMWPAADDDPAPAEAFTVARDRAVRDYIDHNIHRAEFRVGDVCAAFRVSPATIYRMFEPEGGFRTVLRRRRLERAFAELSSSAPLPGQVTRVAERYGFSSVHTFGRAFRAQFGVSPGEAAARRASDKGSSLGKARHGGFRLWLSEAERATFSPA